MLRAIKALFRPFARRQFHHDYTGSTYLHELAQISPPPDYFARKTEVQRLEELFRLNSIFVVTGPPNCGKSRLMNELLKDWTKYTVIKHDFRGVYDSKNILKPISYAINKHLSRQSDLSRIIAEYVISQNLKLKPGFPHIAFNISCEAAEIPRLNEGEIDACEFNNVFENIIDSYHAHYKHSEHKLIVFLDEFNLTKNLENQNLVLSFLSLLVRKSIQEEKIAVVLGVNDPFIAKYLCHDLKLPVDTYGILNIDYLSKNETMQYLDLLKFPKEFHERVYHYFGGDIMKISNLAAMCDGNFTSEKVTDFENFCHSSSCSSIIGLYKHYSDEDKAILYEIFDQLLREPYLDYSLLCEKDSGNLIGKFIQDRLLYLRDGYCLSDEIGSSRFLQVTLNAPYHKHVISNYFKDSGYKSTLK